MQPRLAIGSFENLCILPLQLQAGDQRLAYAWIIVHDQDLHYRSYFLSRGRKP